MFLSGGSTQRRELRLEAADGPGQRGFPASLGIGFPSFWHVFTSKFGWVPSGKHTKNYGKSPFFMGKSTINGDFP